MDATSFGLHVWTQSYCFFIVGKGRRSKHYQIAQEENKKNCVALLTEFARRQQEKKRLESQAEDETKKLLQPQEAVASAKKKKDGSKELELAERSIYNQALAQGNTTLERTPLHVASSNGHEAVVSILLENGADVNAKNNDGSTPLHYAIQFGASGNGHESVVSCFGNENIVSLLLENGANVNAKNDFGSTPLHTACFFGHESIVLFLLEEGADIEAKCEGGQTPLHYASENGHKAIVSLLLEKGAKVNAKSDADGQTPLHSASRSGHKAIVSLLLEKGAEVNAKSDADGHTPLHSASRSGHEAIVSLLLEKGAEVNAKSDADGQTPLHSASRSGHEAIVSSLLEKGADVNAKDDTGWTPLHKAGYNGHEAIISLLLEKGADVNAKDDTGWTPLHKAGYNGHEAIVSLLLEKGADVNAKSDADGQTPLHSASRSGHEAIVSLLLANGYEAMVSILLENGADPTITNNYGRTPLQIAQEYNKQNCVAALEQFQPRFYFCLGEISTLVQHATENEFVSLVPTFEKALYELSDFLQLKYYFTAVNAQHRLGTITTEDRNRLILASLEKAKVWCVSPFHVAMYRVALRYSLSEKIITQFQLDQLDVASLECDIAHTDYIQAMQQIIIRQNAMRINRLENSLVMFQQAVVTSVCELQQNVIAIQENVQNMHRDMHDMAVAIDAQAALKKFKASLEFKRKVEAGCSLVSAVLNAVLLGAAGSALQGVLGLTLASTADFGDLAHLSGVLKQVATTIDDVSIHDIGIMLAQGYATLKLEEALRNENAIVFITASAAVFTNFPSRRMKSCQFLISRLKIRPLLASHLKGTI